MSFSVGSLSFQQLWLSTTDEHSRPVINSLVDNFFCFCQFSLPFYHHLSYNSPVIGDILLCLSQYKIYRLRSWCVGENFPVTLKMYLLCSVRPVLPKGTKTDIATSPCTLSASADNGISSHYWPGCWYSWSNTGRSSGYWSHHFRPSISPFPLWSSLPGPVRSPLYPLSIESPQWFFFLLLLLVSMYTFIISLLPAVFFTMKIVQILFFLTVIAHPSTAMTNSAFDWQRIPVDKWIMPY